jgi:amidase
MSELAEKTLVELATSIRAGEVSPVEVMDEYLRRVGQYNPLLRAIVTLNPQAQERAQAAEKAVIAGRPLGPLHGVPVTIKDTIETANLRTANGSRLYKRYLPEQDAPAVARLKAAGAIVLGKTNTSEVAAAYDAENPVFGRTNNPYDVTLSPGGSSGGEAAAIAACLSPGGLGSDLAGSVRIPAHCCGVVGLKPTQGLVAGEGQWPRPTGPLGLGASLGLLARRAADAYLLFEILHLRRNSGSHNFADPVTLLTTVGQRLRGRSFFWYTDDGNTQVAPEIQTAVEHAVKALEGAGLRGRAERPPGVASGPRLWHELFAYPAAQQLAELYAGHEADAGPALKALFRVQAKRAAPTFDDYLKSWAKRDEKRGLLLRALEETPLIVAPVGAVLAAPHDARRVTVNGQEIPLFSAYGHAQTFNVYGLPAVSVPAHFTDQGLPVGVQIIGRPCAEREALAAAAIIETAHGGWRKPAAVP